MKKVIVTGGAGYIGSHTVVELVSAGYEPIVVDDFSNSHRLMIKGIEKIIGRSLQVYQVDCTDEAEFFKVMHDSGTVEGIIHFAAYKAVGESVEQPLRYYKNNLGSMMVVLDAIQEFEVPSLVFSSSCTVYGEASVLPVTESTPIMEASSPYGSTKQICETMIQDFQVNNHSGKSVVLRYFNPIGAHSSALIGELPIGVPNNLVPYLTQTAAGHRKKLVIFGNDYPTADGTCIRDFIHVSDLARAHVRALEWMKNKETPALETFNLGTGRGNSVLEVVRTFEEVSEADLPFQFGPRRAGDISEMFSDVSKAAKELGWKSQYSLKDALEHAWQWELQLKGKDFS